MIYIWDNGEDYSDHAVYFVEEDILDQAAVVEVLSWTVGGHLVGVAKTVKWRDRSAVSCLEEMIGWRAAHRIAPIRYEHSGEPTWFTITTREGFAEQHCRGTTERIPRAVLLMLGRMVEDPLAREIIGQLRKGGAA